MKEEQIIQSARKLFKKYGYRRVSIEEIARDANVTKRTLYNYFKSKEELLKYFLDEEVQKMKKIVEDCEDENKSFFESLHEAICKLMNYIQKRNFLKIMIDESEAFKNPVIVENLKVIDDMIQNYIKEKLEKAMNDGEIYVENVDVMAFVIFKIYIALMLEWDHKKDKVDDELVADTIIDLLKNGLEIKKFKKGRILWSKKKQ